MRLFILFILIVFCNKSLAQDNKKLNQYFSNKNYSLYVSYFENIFKSALSTFEVPLSISSAKKVS